MLKTIKKRCIIEQVQQEKVSLGGIVLQNDQTPNPQARVVNIGSEVTEVKVGDIICVDWRYVVQITHDDHKLYVTDESNILAIEE
jgi:co-chaperonin GroES (HSP10)